MFKTYLGDPESSSGSHHFKTYLRINNYCCFCIPRNDKINKNFKP